MPLQRLRVAFPPAFHYAAMRVIAAFSPRYARSLPADIDAALAQRRR